MAMSHSTRDESAYLDTEEARACRKYKREERLDSASRSQSAMGAAAKYLRRVTRASQRLTVQGQPRVGHRQNYAD
jgi:hypothetical protein